MSACIRHQCDNHDFDVNVHNHTGGARRIIFVSGKSLVNPIALTSLPLTPLIFRDDSFRFRGSTTGISRAVVDAFIEVPERERGSHASSEKSRARAVDKARDVGE